jgi:phage-related protein
MFDRSKKLQARFYQTAGGSRPVRDWIVGLEARDKFTVGKDIQKVEFGWPIGRPHCAPIGDGLWEIRSELGSNRIARLIFCITAGDMILLHAFVKKTQKLPGQDIALALKRKREVLQ